MGKKIQDNKWINDSKDEQNIYVECLFLNRETKYVC